jgi:signal transduction histidine kinase
MNEVAASIVHEISQPLGAILINASACLRWLSSQVPPIAEIRAALVDIAAAGHRAKELVRRNRELFENVRPKKAALDVNSVVRDVALLARTRLESNQVTLGATLDEGLPAVLGDRVELQQVIMSLLVNAINATEAVDSASRRIQIHSSLVEDNMVRVAVRDNGIGLEGVAVGRMLTPSYTATPAGTGFGLSICRSIVDAHGGRLWAESHDGPGATFCFTLPTVDGFAGAPSARTRASEEDRPLESSVNARRSSRTSAFSSVKHDERLTGAYKRR